MCRQRIRARVAIGLLLIAFFVVYRWFMRVEPFHSDDIILFGFSVDAANGEHWLFQSRPQPVLSHQALRIGLLPFSVPAILTFGPTHRAYYLVPLFFCLCGFILIWFVMDREIDRGWAFIFALVHLALPFEIIESSQFLVDLPAAVMMVLCLVVIDWGASANERNPRVAAIRGSLAGLVGLEGYLLRENSPVLLVPAFLLLLCMKRTRRVTVWAVMVLAIGICLEQVLYLAKGLGWGFRWAMVRNSVESFSPFLPVYTWGEFPLRGFSYLFRVFHRWPDGVLAVVFYGMALIAHVVVVLRSQSLLLRVLALTGLTTWCVFSFAVYERVGDSVRALAPPLFRYFQPFFYTAIISLCWMTAALYALFPRVARIGLGLGVVTLIIMSLFVSTRDVPLRLSRPTGDVYTVLRAIDHLGETNGGQPLHIYGTPEQLRVIALFRGPWSDPPVVWQRREIEELATLVHQRIPALWFRDKGRERMFLRYEKGEAVQRYREATESLQKVVGNQYEPLSTTARFTLYRAVVPSSGSFLPHPP